MSVTTKVKLRPALPRLTKRQRAKLQVRIAYRRTRGVDPTTHLWYQFGATVRRVCDDGDWGGDVPEHDKGGFNVTCPMCSDLRFEDGVHGFGLLRYCSDLPGFYGMTGQGWVEHRYNVRMPDLQLRHPPETDPEHKVKAVAFAEYCSAGESKRWTKVRAHVPKGQGHGGFDHYWELRLAVKDLIKTNDLRRMEPSFHNLAEGRPSMLGPRVYRYLASQFSDTDFLPPYKGLVEFEGLGVDVNSDIVIQNEYGDEKLLMLWLLKSPLSQHQRQVLSFLFRRAREEWGWPTELGFGIFDVQNQVIRDEVSTDPDFEEREIRPTARDFVSKRSYEIQRRETAEQNGSLPSTRKGLRNEPSNRPEQQSLWPDDCESPNEGHDSASI